MHRHARTAATALALILQGSAFAGPPGELTLATGYWTGEFGDDARTETHATTLRYILGNDVQFRAELPLLRVRSAASVVVSGPGRPAFGAPASTHAGNGSGSGSGSQTGSGGGASPVVAAGIDSPGADTWTTGLGDVWLALGGVVAGGGVELFRLEAGAQCKIPTADSDDGLGTGEWDLRLGLAGEYRFWSTTLFGGAGWTRFGDPAWIDYQDGADVYLGLEGYAFRESVAVSGWVDVQQEVLDDLGLPTVLGLEVRSLRRLRWRVALTAGLGSAAEDFGVILGYSFYSGASSKGRRGMLR